MSAWLNFPNVHNNLKATFVLGGAASTRVSVSVKQASSHQCVSAH